MDGDIVERMRAEEEDLAKKLEAVRAFLAVYGGTPTAGGAGPTQKAKPGSREKVEIEGYGAYGRVVVAEAMRMMMTSSHPMKTSQLVAPIEAMGIEITGQNKINALGALLARSTNIRSHGKAGWSLVDREKAAKIVTEYGSVQPKEIEPSSENAVGSKPAGWGAPTPSPAPSPSSSSWPS
jgi:hypothetical protein